MLKSNWAICSKKKSTFIKNKELHNFDSFKRNKIYDKVSLTEDKFISELHLQQPGLTYSACGPFIKHRERIYKFGEIGNLKHLHRNELGKACFAHDATYSDSKYLAKRTNPDKILKDSAYELLEIVDMMDIKED